MDEAHRLVIVDSQSEECEEQEDIPMMFMRTDRELLQLQMLEIGLFVPPSLWQCGS
jgi:hypothetical protein